MLYYNTKKYITLAVAVAITVVPYPAAQIATASTVLFDPTYQINKSLDFYNSKNLCYLAVQDASASVS